MTTKSNRQVGIGIIGIGNRLLLTQDVLKCSPDIKVVALCDPSEYAIERAQRDLAQEATVHEDYRSLCQDPRVDWVFIGSWNCFHPEHAIAAFEAGKHVFCEKPLATNIDDCLTMRDVWKRSDSMFTIGFTLRYSPHYRAIKDLLAANRAGKIISFEFNETLGFNHGGYIHSDWRRLRKYAGTHLLEKCCHDIDIANWYTESRVARVASFGGLDFFRPENKDFAESLGVDKDGKPAYMTWPSVTGLDPFTADKDIIDNQVVILEYESGARATFHTNCNAGFPERRMYVCGSRGAIRADAISGAVDVIGVGFDAKSERIDTACSDGHAGGDAILTKSLADSMLHGTPPYTSLDDGLFSAVTCFAIDEAMDTGKVVDVAPYWEKVDAALKA